MKHAALSWAFFLAVAAGDSNANLVTWYPFDGNALDTSGQGNNATVHGAVLSEDRFGNANSAYRFDGVNNFISASAAGLPTGARTVALWFQADSVAAPGPVLLGYGGGGCGTSFFLGMNATKSIYNNSFYASSHCDVNNLISHYASDPVNAWFHIAVTTDAGGTKLYINGTQVASNAIFISNTAVAGTELAIGVDVSPGGIAPYTDINVGFFKGSIDDVRIYDSALSAQDIAGLAQSIPEPSTWLMIGAGMGALALVGARRRKREV